MYDDKTWEVLQSVMGGFLSGSAKLLLAVQLIFMVDWLNL